MSRLADAGFLVAVLAALPSCGPAAGGMDPSSLLGVNGVIGRDGPIVAGIPGQAGPTSAPRPPIGAACAGAGGSARLCLAVKYVVYQNPNTGAPLLDETGVVDNVAGINRLWSRCGVQFQVEQYLAVRPADYQLNFQTASFDELDQIRSAFADNGELLIVTTGTWDRKGTLGDTSANAWTAMPGAGVHGTVLEQPVSGFSNIIAHELGHYLNLLHVKDDLDLMNPIIYSNSASLTPEQCSDTRTAVAFFWPQMYR